MINFEECKGLFVHSTFSILKRDSALEADDKNLSQRLLLPNDLDKFHSQRKEEFILGRLCACKAYSKLMNDELLNLPVGPSREPLWPGNIVGSISHNKYWVGAAVAKKVSLMGLGIDLEVMGRTRPELARYITNDHDLTSVQGFSDEELLTLIFSAKESLYKALFPLVNKFFGFDAAAVRAVNIKDKTFEIHLLTHLSDVFTPDQRSRFTGRYERDNSSCLTVIELLPS